LAKDREIARLEADIVRLEIEADEWKNLYKDKDFAYSSLLLKLKDSESGAVFDKMRKIKDEYDEMGKFLNDELSNKKEECKAQRTKITNLEKVLEEKEDEIKEVRKKASGFETDKQCLLKKISKIKPWRIIVITADVLLFIFLSVTAYISYRFDYFLLLQGRIKILLYFVFAIAFGAMTFIAVQAVYIYNCESLEDLEKKKTLHKVAAAIGTVLVGLFGILFGILQLP